jgi:hypothetical protein
VRFTATAIRREPGAHAYRLLDMRSLAVLAVALVVMGCASVAQSVISEAPARGATASPAGTSSHSLGPSITPTAVGSASAPEGSSKSSSWWSSGLTFCGVPAKYRVNSGPPIAVGDCAELLLDPASTVTVHVGDELDLHVTTSASEASPSQEPIYPTPTTAASTVLRLMAVTDGGATVTYRAIAPGTALLTTSGLCLHVANDRETKGSCPVLLVTVSSG